MSELQNSDVREPKVATQGSSMSSVGAAVAVAGLAATSVLGSRVARAVSPPLTFAQIPGSGDIKVLNFALALEALEAELYAQAYLRLAGGGTSPLGTHVTGLSGAIDPRLGRFTYEFGIVENQHRDFLINALGSQAITNTTLKGATFNFNINSLDQRGVLELLLDAEATGVAAYLGAIPFFSSTKSPYVPIAVAIQGTEARHTAIFADLENDLYNPAVNVAPLASQNQGRDPYPSENGAGKIPNTPPGQPPLPDNVLAKVSPFIVLPQ
ncbi:MAG: ferritin-like domain-containing protein [Abitibacteriaceae bacterium]|nr:ferritin-like domain-containing protein [Abditibacteriaceae bacterium]MBV9867303.1 ferritin-like domain-containing protein [Abditibacteriaceae bacterium]